MTANERAQLAALIRERRDALGLTQSELAEASRTTRQTISNVETASTVPQQAVLTRILDALGISPHTAQDPDVEAWVGIIGGMLQALSEPTRSRAGQAAVNAIAAEIATPIVHLNDRRNVRASRQDLPEVAFETSHDHSVDTDDLYDE